MVVRLEKLGWSLRWDDARAADARARGLWIDETIGDFAARHAAERPDALVLVDGDVRIDAQTLYGEARKVAASLIARGLKPGDAVSFMLPNWHEAATIYLAASLAGLVIQPIVPQLRDREVGFQLEDIASKAIFIPAEFRKFDYRAMMARIAATMATPPEVVVLRGDPAGFTAYADLLDGDGSAPLPKVDADSVKLVLYTSGTTGLPKGVIHTHNSINALATQIHQHWRANQGDAFFVPSPISHIGGSIYAFELPMIFGTAAILQESWDPAAAVAIMLREGCTHMAGATPFLQALLDNARDQGTTLPDLTVFICGGASVPPALIREASGYFTGCTISRVFGSTEVPVTTVGSMTHGDLAHGAETDGKVGIAEVKLAGGGSEGELLVRGPQMLFGYVRPEHEDGAFTDDGFYRTGDLGRSRTATMSVVISGRAKDIIIRKGENIAPKEIEDLLVTHPAHRRDRVIGLPDPTTGERACAVIVPRDGEAPDVAELGAFLRRGQCSPPSRFRSRSPSYDALPRTTPARCSNMSCAPTPDRAAEQPDGIRLVDGRGRASRTHPLGSRGCCPTTGRDRAARSGQRGPDRLLRGSALLWPTTGLLIPHWPSELRRRATTSVWRPVHHGRGGLVRGRAARAAIYERQLDRPGADALRHAGPAGPLSAADPRGRGHLVPGLLRALGRLGSGRAAHHGGPGRGRLQRHRRQGLDLLRRARRHLLPARPRPRRGGRGDRQGRHRHPAGRHEVGRHPGEVRSRP
jgi:acyl-CoA synthetase (AMP-forming)/AMP-acid ligase II